MSDLRLCELEDLVWDDFYQGDDCIVPHPGSGTGRATDHSILGDSHKKRCHEVTSFSNSTGDRSSDGHVNLGRGQGGSQSLNKRAYMMLENDSWCNKPGGVSPSSPERNFITEKSSVASENTSSRHASKSNKMGSNNNELCINITILSDKSTAVDNNSFGDTLGDITNTETNLDFFENTDNKDSSELLYYGWPEIGYFEDVDRMFRSCDSTFGIGTSKEDELVWFESADNVGGSGDTVKSEFEFPYPEPNTVEYISHNHDSSKNDFINDFSMTGDDSWTSENSDSYMSFVNGPAMANSKDRFIPKQQINKNQVKLQVQSIGKRKHQYLGNGSFNDMFDLPSEPMQLPLSHVHSNDSPDDLTSVNPAPCAVKSETRGLRSLSPRDPSHASIQLQSNAKFPVAGKREKLSNRQGSQSSAYGRLESATAIVQASIADPGFTGKRVQYSGDEKHGDPGGASLLIPAEVGSARIQESSKMSSGVDDVSQEAASFRQLQLVLKQLDLRTKICIRNSLYRLARSAEQRHKQGNLNGNCAAERDAGGAFGTNNFMDMETNTNPIDRSIAHLLFHRSSDPPKMVHGSIIGPPVMVENLIAHEESASKIEKNTDR